MFITDTQDIIYSHHGEIHSHSISRDHEKKMSTEGKICFMDLGLKQEKHKCKSLLVEGNNLINDLMNNVMIFLSRQ